MTMFWRDNYANRNMSVSDTMDKRRASRMDEYTVYTVDNEIVYITIFLVYFIYS